MASMGEIEVPEKEIQVENKENHEEIVSVELPAPNGWKKKFIPKKGGTPKRNEIVFISPTGEEIKHKRQLDLFLKAHPGGPPSSEFDWGTGDTPRRSARISEKSKATETPEHEPVKKRERKSSSKKGAKEDGDDVDGETPKKEQAAAAVDESKASPDVEMKEVENGGDKTMDEATIGEDVAAQDGGDKTEDEVTTGEAKTVQQDGEDKTVDEKVKTGESMEVQQDAEDKNEETTEENNAEKDDKPAEADSKVGSDSKDEQVENNSLPPPAADSNKESEVPPPLSGSTEEAAKKETEVAVESSENDGKLGDVTSSEKEVKTGEVLPDNSSHKEIQAESKPMETSSVNCEEAQHQPKTPPVSC